MRTSLIMIALAGCGGGDDLPIDAMPNMAAVTIDCPTYCADIQANCTGANAQYLDMAHCIGTCASFTKGASRSGNTLGCRTYFAGGPSKTGPEDHCVHSGPAGDLITATHPVFCSGGDVCASFCTLEIMACGSLDAPLAGNPRDVSNNPLFQYRNMADCMNSCAGFNKTHEYSTTAAGDSLACRLYHATRAAIAVTPDGAMNCSATAADPTGPCAGTAMP